MEDEIAILLEYQEKTINILKQALDLAIGKKRAAMEAASALEEENAEFRFLFSLQENAERKATEMWKARGKRAFDLPGRKRLLLFLMEEIERLKEAKSL